MELNLKHAQPEDLFSEFIKSYEGELLVDVKLISGSDCDPIKCHKVILASASDYLKSLLHGDFEDDEICVIVPDISRNELSQLVNALYGKQDSENGFIDAEVLDMLGVSLDTATTDRESEVVGEMYEKSKLETVMTFHLPMDVTNSGQIEEFQDVNIEDLNSSIVGNLNGDKDITILEIDNEQNCNLEDTLEIGKPINVIKYAENGPDKSSPAKILKQKAQCDICNKKFGSAKKLKVHKMRAHLSEDANGFTCNHCNMVLATASSLEIHIRSHTGHRPFACSECDKSFTSLHYLVQHKDFHRKTKDFECEICHKKYQNSNALTQHKTDFHSNVKFQCDICFKLFSAKRYLREHERKKHSSITSYDCDICGKTLSGKNELKIHSRIHTGEKPFHCDECNKDFRARSTYTIHMKSHSGTKNAVCEECGKRFIQWGDLRKHKRTHTGERPFTCNACGRAFARKDYLTKHERTHRNEKVDALMESNGDMSPRTADRVAVTSISRPAEVLEESMMIDVSDLRSLVTEDGSQIQVVTILDASQDLVEFSEENPNDSLKNDENVMYVITN